MHPSSSVYNKIKKYRRRRSLKKPKKRTGLRLEKKKKKKERKHVEELSLDVLFPPFFSFSFFMFVPFPLFPPPKILAQLCEGSRKKRPSSMKKKRHALRAKKNTIIATNFLIQEKKKKENSTDKHAPRLAKRRVAPRAPRAPCPLLLAAPAAQQVAAVERDLDLALEADAALGTGRGGSSSSGRGRQRRRR